MALRPIAFSIPSSTELKIIFSEPVSELISKDNFKVESLSGNTDDLQVIGVSVNNSVILVKTRPQSSGNYYLLKMLDTDVTDFKSNSGAPLVRDEVSREIFFVGIENVNPVRDRIFESVPDFYELDNTVIGEVLKTHSEELYSAQKDIGELLSDNYLSIKIIDELRTRSSGATDRLINENAYEIERVSKYRTSDLTKFNSIKFSEESSTPRIKKFPNYPVSLSQVYVKREELSIDSEDNNFNGFLLSLKNKNVLKILEVDLIKKNELPNYKGDIGKKYDIEKYKYKILNNRYDPYHSFSYADLSSNQVLLSFFGNIEEPKPGDKIFVSYLYEDKGRLPNSESVVVFNIQNISNEPIPSSSVRFFLKNAPIVDENNKVPKLGGVSFTTGENSDRIPEEFKKEIEFSQGKLPNKIGEYSVNYRTGEVYLVGGATAGTGTGNYNYSIVANYSYRNVFENSIDYIIDKKEIVANSTRDLSEKEVTVNYSYDVVYAEGQDYKLKNHIEVQNEHISNNIDSSFSIKPLNTPITNVFRIYNQTTGEVYNPLYFTDSKVFFSGIRSPEIKSISSELVRFKNTSLEDLAVVGEFVVPSFTTTIKSSSSTNNIILENGIPSELIDQNTQEYFVRTKSESDGKISVKDLNIRFFGDEGSDGRIDSFAVGTMDVVPSAGDEVIIGVRGFEISLKNTGVINKSLDSIGSFVNSSLEFENQSIFKREKFFKPLKVNPGFKSTVNDGYIKSIASEKGEDFYINLSRIRKVGDYCVDYQNGVVYVGVGRLQEYNVGSAKYTYNKIDTINKNILTANNAFKKEKDSDELKNSVVIYNNLSSNSKEVSVNDLENSLYVYDGESTFFDLSGNEQKICTVLSDNTVVLPKKAKSVKGIFYKKDIEGELVEAKLKKDRYSEYESASLLKSIEEGGRNLFRSGAVTINENIIDFKKYKTKRFIKSKNGFILKIKDKNYNKFLNLRISGTNTVLFDESLNVPKLSGLNIANVKLSNSESISSVLSGVDLSDIDTSTDFLMDSNGAYFKIKEYDNLLSTITTTGNSINRPGTASPSVNTDSSAKIIVKASLVSKDYGVDIIVPSTPLVREGDVAEVVYLDKYSPNFGDRLAVDFKYGNLFLDYSYVYDDIYIYYEYGDNEIDWSVSNSISEGEEYYVTYKYGALRGALRKNFGDLTGINYFKDFSLTTDREVYRSALVGALQAFPNGPTIPSFKTIVSSITDIDPNIQESAFGNWILGRDYISTNDVKFSGDLKFENGRFNQGLMVKEGNSIQIPSSTGISTNEGTISSWVKTDWSGIDNDATLEIYLDNIGTSRFVCNHSKDIFSQGFDLLNTSDRVGGVDDSDNSLSIYNNSKINDLVLNKEVEKIGSYIINKDFKNLSRVVKSSLSFGFDISYLSKNNFNLIGKNDVLSNPFLASIGDDEKTLIISASLKTLKDNLNKSFIFDIKNNNLLVDDFPDYDRDHPTKNSPHPVQDIIDLLSNYKDKLIVVNLPELIDVSHFIESETIISNSCSNFILANENGHLYKVLSFLDQDSRLRKDIPKSIKSIVVSRTPINSNEIITVGPDQLNSTLPVGKLMLTYQSVSLLVDNKKDNSKNILEYRPNGIVADFISSRLDLDIDRDPAANRVKVILSKDNYNHSKMIECFYTDLPNCEDSAMLASLSGYSERSLSVINNLRKISSGISFGTTDSSTLSYLNVYDIASSIVNRFSEKDIYIGKNASNPSSVPFSVNKKDSLSSSLGIPYNSNSSEGVFIGFDELCQSELSENSGQWVFKTRTSEQVLLPDDVRAFKSQKMLCYISVEKKKREHKFFGRGSQNAFYSGSDSGIELRLEVGKTYRFDQSNFSNRGGSLFVESLRHPIAFSTKEDGVHSGGSEYTRGVKSFGSPGSKGSYTEITVDKRTPKRLYIYCKNHKKMGFPLIVSNSKEVKEVGQKENCFSYEMIDRLFPTRNVFSGNIVTTGEFSSVIRARRKEDGSGCSMGTKCSDLFRYCGGGKLEDSGWKRISEAQSSLINTIIGGYESDRNKWITYGSFKTSESSGVYRAGPSAHKNDDINKDISLGNFLYVESPCHKGDVEITSSVKVSRISDQITKGSTGLFSGSISGFLTGINPIDFNDSIFNVKVSLALDTLNNPLILVVDGANNSIVDMAYYNWNNNLFNTFRVKKSSATNTIELFINDLIISKLSISEFSKENIENNKILNKPYLAIHVFDGSLLDSKTFHEENVGNIVDLDLIQFSGVYEEGVSTLEDEDIFINTDSKIEFSFKSGKQNYIDGYGMERSLEGSPTRIGSDGYDGYTISPSYDVDEMYINSDNLKYLFDSGESESESRMSIFKDGKGFLNFRVIDNERESSGGPGIYNIATNVKNFKSGGLHHIAGSWRFNSNDHKDEMHLFIDGVEAPNIFRFGGSVPVSINNKFSDISKEVLLNYETFNIDFKKSFKDGIVYTGSNKLFSNSASFSKDMIGRSLYIKSSKVGNIFVGKHFLINDVDGDSVSLVYAEDLQPATFNSSVNNIEFCFPPISGVSNNVLTDLKNSKFAIFKEDTSGAEEEFGGVLYRVKSGIIQIISGDNIKDPKFRANVDNRVIEFIGKDEEGKASDSVSYSDIDIHIKTYGLKTQRYRSKLDLASSTFSTYFGERRPKHHEQASGKSIVRVSGPKPIALEDVKIKRVLVDRTSVIPRNITSLSTGHLASFSIDTGSERDVRCPPDIANKRQYLTSQPSEVLDKQNMGRYLELFFDSDNVIFCNNFDGYAAYDGYSSLASSGFLEVCDGTYCWPEWIGQYCAGQVISSKNFGFKDNVLISRSADYIYVISDGIPRDHTSGHINRLYDDDQDRDKDGVLDSPNSIKPVYHRFSIPKNPIFADEILMLKDVPSGPIGVCINGIPLLNSFSSDGSYLVDGVDDCNGKADATGEYSYLGDPKCIYNDIPGEMSPLIGYMFDGFKIYGKQCSNGKVPDDLDECGGHYTEEHGYHYHVRESEPHIIRAFRGVVEKSNFDNMHRLMPPPYTFSRISSGVPNLVTVFGETDDGLNFETFVVNENGKFRGKKLFKNIERIEGSLNIADPDYEVCVVSLSEADNISVSNNGGDRAEITKYNSGEFEVNTYGSSASFPFELHPGLYEIDYPAYLKVSIPKLGRLMNIGSNIKNKESINSVLDAFKISSEMSHDTRITENPKYNRKSVTSEYNETVPPFDNKQTLTLINFNNPISSQSRKLRMLEFLDSNSNYKYKLEKSQVSSLLKNINNEIRFISDMIKMGFTELEAQRVFSTCSLADGGPIINESKYYPDRNDFYSGLKSVNSSFGSCARFYETRPLLISNSKNFFRKKEGSMEFWISPYYDSAYDDKIRYFLDIYSASRQRVSSSSPNYLDLPIAASKILNIRMISKASSDLGFYSQSEKDSIIFDDISRSKITGELHGGSGTGLDFSIGSSLSADGKRVTLSNSLPNYITDVIVDYIPAHLSGDRVSIFKDTNGDIVFSVTANGVDNIVRKTVNWQKNTWHRVMCSYKTNSNKDIIRMFVDGDEGGVITYGQDIKYGTGYVYGQIATNKSFNKSKDYNIKLSDTFRVISIGSDVFGDNPSNCRMDNVRFSRKQRSLIKDSLENYIDPNYSSNLNSVSPVVKDDLTTLILDFNNQISDNESKFAKIIDPIGGIFDFDIEVVDDFGKINKEETEDLIVELINRLKPAHSNANIKFLNKLIPSVSSGTNEGISINSDDVSVSSNQSETSGANQSVQTQSSSQQSGVQQTSGSSQSSSGGGGGYSY